MNRETISLAVGMIRDDHILLGLGNPVKHGKQSETVRIHSRRTLALLLAAAALLVLGVTAYAAGWLDSIFSRAAEKVPMSEVQSTLYENAAEGSQKDPVTVALRDLPGNTFTLSESYYDGESLLLAYRVDSMLYPVEFWPDPDPEQFNDMVCLGHWYINIAWQTIMSQEEYYHVERMLREEEQCGFTVRYAYLGDHIRLKDGTDLGPWVSFSVDGSVVLQWQTEESDIPTDNGLMHVLQNGLPPEAQDREALELVFTVKEVLEHHCKIGENYYYGNEPLGEETVTITVPITRTEG